jgi:hypothetical protein
MCCGLYPPVIARPGGCIFGFGSAARGALRRIRSSCEAVKTTMSHSCRATPQQARRHSAQQRDVMEHGTHFNT